MEKEGKGTDDLVGFIYKCGRGWEQKERGVLNLVRYVEEESRRKKKKKKRKIYIDIKNSKNVEIKSGKRECWGKRREMD